MVLTTPGPLLGDVIVNVTDDGTGSAGGADYTFTSPTQVTFLAGSTNGATETATITITDDDFDESNETIDLSLSLNSAPLDTIVASSITSHTVTITDDDTAGVTVFPMSVTVTEGGTTDSYTVVLESQPTNNVTITPSTNNGEVTVSPNSHTFVPGNWDQAETFIVTAVDDGDVEGEHFDTITHAVTGDSQYAALPTIDSVAVTITDNDDFDISIADLASAETDGNPTFLFTVSISPQSPANITVDYSTATGGGGNPAGATEFESISNRQFTILANTSTVDIDVITTGDDVDEDEGRLSSSISPTHRTG